MENAKASWQLILLLCLMSLTRLPIFCQQLNHWLSYSEAIKGFVTKLHVQIIQI